MSNGPSSLKHMGTQSHETMAMEAALAERAVRAGELATDVADESTVIGDAAGWAVDKAKAAVSSAAGYVGDRANATLKGYIAHDPLRAMLVAAGTGAVLMALATMLARSGARTVRRKLER